MKRIVALICLTAALFPVAKACTSAIIGADMNPYGRPLLWKNRDTSNFDNVIEYMAGENGELGYVGLYNASDTLRREVWMGMNEYGFAIMNTASYNLKDDDVAQKDMDKEGLVMTRALKICKKVDDFAALLDTIGKPMGVEANFGVIDAYGDGAYFETNNHSYRKYDLKEAADHVMVRTNYSHSGRDNEGFGFTREANAEKLLAPYIAGKDVRAEVLTEVLSRSFYHDLLGTDFSETDAEWVIDQDFIPRYTSTATIVIEGCVPLAEGAALDPEFLTEEYIMWTGLGYPPCSEIYPVWCKEDGVSEGLKADVVTGRSAVCDAALERKGEVFPLTKGNGNKYISMQKLRNRDNDGYIQILSPRNLAMYKTIRDERKGD